MSMIVRCYRTLQYLSIDISIGAVVLLRFCCRLHEVEASWVVQLVVGLSVWVVYTFDHLLDAFKTREKQLKARYQFHWRYRRVLVALMISGCCVLFSAIPFLPKGVLHAGIGVLICTFVYLALQRMLSFGGYKELAVALIFTAGVVFVPCVLKGALLLSFSLCLFLLSLLNLVMYSWFEEASDHEEGIQSIATIRSTCWMEKLLLLLLSLGLTFSLLASFSSLYYVYFLITFCIYGALLAQKGWSSCGERYRAIADGVFLLPALMEFY